MVKVSYFDVSWSRLEYTEAMFTIIERRLKIKRWLAQTIEWYWMLSIGMGFGILVCHRLLQIEGWWLLTVVPLVPVVSWFWTPIVLKRDVLQYAEQTSGETGMLLFGDAVASKNWRQEVDDLWKDVQPPNFEVPSSWRKSLLGTMMACLLLLIPVREDTINSVLPTLVQSEIAETKEQIEQFESLLQETDSEVENWKERIEQIEDTASVGSALRQLDQLSEQMDQRGQQAMDSLEQAMEALEQQDQQGLAEAMQQLQSQNLMPRPADATQNTDGQNNATKSAEGTGGQEQTKEQQSQQQGNQSGQGEGQSLQEQLQSLQNQLQQMQQSQQSRRSQSQSKQSSSQGSQANGSSQSSSNKGINSMSNQELQQASQQLQQASSSQQGKGQNGSPAGQQGEGQGEDAKQGLGQGKGQSAGNGEGEGESGNGEGGGEGTGDPSGDPSTGGGSAPLTYGEGSLVPNTNLRALDGIPQVDWERSVAFGSSPGQAGDVQPTSTSTDGSVSLSNAVMTGQSQIPPQYRQTVQQFFSTGDETKSTADE